MNYNTVLARLIDFNKLKIKKEADPNYKDEITLPMLHERDSKTNYDS